MTIEKFSAIPLPLAGGNTILHPTSTGAYLRSRWIPVRGFRMHSRSSVNAASGKIPFVLVHGLLISSVYFAPLAECLARDRETHAIDLPGFGLSDGPVLALPVPVLADRLAEWLRVQGIERAHLVANSLGCQILAALAVGHPSAVASLTFIGPTTDPAAPRMWQQAFRILPDVPYERPMLWFNHLIDDWRAGLIRAVGMLRHMFADRIELRLPHIPHPTTIIRGAGDSIAPHRWICEAAAMMRNATARTLPQGGHCIHYSHPEIVSELVLTFARKVESERGGGG